MSTKKTHSTSAARQITRKPKGESLPFYRTIEEIPLYNFLKCLCDNDFAFLYKGAPKNRDIEKEVEVFSELAAQYTDANEGKSTAYEDIKKIAGLLAKIRVCEASIGVIDKLPESIQNSLKSMGIRLANDAQKNVLVLHGKISGFVREYNSLMEKEDKKDKSTKPTISQYIDILTAMSTHFKMYLDIHLVTAASFCSYYKQFTKEMEALNKVSRKRK
jgi:hypothetical protein